MFDLLPSHSFTHPSHFQKRRCGSFQCALAVVRREAWALFFGLYVEANNNSNIISINIPLNIRVDVFVVLLLVFVVVVASSCIIFFLSLIRSLRSSVFIFHFD